jgi:glutamate racemase
VKRVEGRETPGERARVSFERRRQVLDEVDLVHVPGRDRLPDGSDRRGIVGAVPGPGPLADPKGADLRRRFVEPPDAAGGERQWTRFRGIGNSPAPDRRREPIAAEDVGDEPVRAPAEEPSVSQVILHRGEGALRLPDLEHGANATRSRSYNRPVDERPIGIFDSGAGGLTVLHECLVTMPHEDFLYLGDGARCPYGPRPREEIGRFAHEIASYLEVAGVKLIVAACNSATAAALPQLQERLVVPIVGVLAPEAHAAVQATRNRRVGVLATEVTVESGRYAEAVHALDAGAHVVATPCPRLVPLIEGAAPMEEIDAAVREYAGPLKDAGVDTVILGCTHYPLIRPVFERVFGRTTTLVFSAEETAREVAQTLERKGIAGDPAREGNTRFLTTGSPDEFRRLGERFLQLPIASVEQVAIRDLELAAA